MNFEPPKPGPICPLQSNPSLSGSAAPRAVRWSIQRHAIVETTQALGRLLPAWSAVVAESQTHGRGQYDRKFTSDVGGFYMTAVLPFDGDSARWRGFALAVGWAVRAKLCEAGMTNVRLRWPNDLMIGCRKVGGILVEQGGRQTVLVGLGLNVSNRPWQWDEPLRTLATRLADQPGFLFTKPSQMELPILEAIAAAHAEFSRLGLAGMNAMLNDCWQGPRSVELTLIRENGPELLGGLFLGIDHQGCLLLKTSEGSSVAVAEHHVQRLREI